MGPRRDPEVQELRRLLRQVLRALWRRRRPPDELGRFLRGPPRVGPRHIALLSHVGTEGVHTVGELAAALGLSLPAASRIARDLEEHDLVHRREAIEDKRRTVVHLNAQSATEVEAWLGKRDEPLRNTLATLTEDERAGFLKGLRALAEELMRESGCGPLGSHHRPPRRRRPHRDRPV
jgi:DNA-binding MarR family transcriptional regulator